MKVFLQAFVDTNFGDNMFIHTMVTRYPEHIFYMCVNKEYKSSYEILAKQEKNICLVNENSENDILQQVDALIFAGGDMFGNGADYSFLISKIRKVKDNNGYVAFLGQSLFDDYSRQTKLGLSEMFSYADIIVVREKDTYAQLKKMAPWANVVASTDMAFTLDVAKLKTRISQKNVLGISIRKKIPRKVADAYNQYCDGVAKTAMSYLKQDDKNTIRFMAFSVGMHDDTAVAEDIMNRCQPEYRERMQCISFDGDVETYIDEIQKCEKLLCTRFHALVFGIMLDKPLVPIVYEDKMVRLLNAIGYEGFCPRYEDEWDVATMLESLETNRYSEEKLSQYLDGAKKFFMDVDGFMKSGCSKRRCFQRIRNGLIHYVFKILSII